MQKIIFVVEDCLTEVNEKLRDGWEVKMIVPYNQPVARGEGYTSVLGDYGAYVVLER